MKLYLLLFAVFLVQEPISSNAVLLEAYQYHYNIWIIHLLFVTATLIDIFVGYYLGVMLHKRFSENRFVSYIRRKAESFMELMGKNGRRLVVFIYGPSVFPITAIVMPWIGVSFLESVSLLFISDLIFWYGGEWLVVLGVKTFLPDPQVALYAVIGLSIVLLVASKYIKAYFLKKKGKEVV